MKEKALFLLTWVAVAVANGALENEEKATEVPPEWGEAISQLRADEFAIREKAAATLSELPVTSLPWIEEHLNRSAGDDPEFLRRLAGVGRSIRERETQQNLEHGLQISLDLKAAKPGAVLEAIQSKAPRLLIGTDVRDLWGDAADSAEDFKFEGSYWQALDRLFSTFPPKASEQPGREQVDAPHDLIRLEEGDFAAAAQPSCSAGVLRVRASRTAVEHSNGRDYFTVTLVPKLEPTYLPDEVALLLKGIRFADGTVLEPEKRLRRFERSGYRTDTNYQPGRDFTWELELEDEIDRSGPVSLDAAMQVKVRRMEWIKRDMPALNGSVDFTDAISLTVEEADEKSMKLKFEGEEGTRVDFNQYSRGGTIRLFEILDADGKNISFNIRGSSSGSGGDTWHQTFNCHFDDGKPVGVKALLPGERLTKRLPIIIEGVPIPGMGKG